MKTNVHASAGIAGFLIIVSFWIATVSTELFGSHAAIAAVKNGILWGMIVLIPVLMLAGASGISLSKSRSGVILQRKKKRMPLIAMNGLLILVPSAFFLAGKANANAFDGAFYAV